MEDDQEIEQKQAYLRTEIIDKGYSPEDFMSFLEQQGEGKTFLENWKFDDLKSIVAVFQIQVNENNNIPQANVEQQNDYDNNHPYPDQQEMHVQDDEANLQENWVDVQPQENNSNNNNNNEEEVVEKAPKLQEEQNYQLETIECTKLQQTSFTDNNELQFIVSEPKMVNNGFFSIPYCEYKVTMLPSNMNVTRKKADFVWLHQKLSEYFPDNIIPPLPPYHLILKDDSPKTVLYLNSFLNSLAKIKLLRTHSLFESFVTLSQQQFSAEKKKFIKNQTPKNYQARANLEGFIDITINPDIEKKAAQINIQKKIDVFLKLDKNFNRLLDLFKETGTVLLEISEQFKELSTNYTEEPEIEKGFSKIKDIMFQWHTGYSDQEAFVRKEMKYYFKFMQKELTNTEPLINKLKNAKGYYESQSKKMKGAYTPKDQTLMDEYKKNYGFYLNILNKEYRLLLERQRQRMKNQLIKMCDEKEKFIGNYQKFISLFYYEI